MKKIAIIANASLPWKTGTSINALMRAHYLAKKGFQVDLYLPEVTLEEDKTGNMNKNINISWVAQSKNKQSLIEASKDFLKEDTKINFKFYQAEFQDVYIDCCENVLTKIINDYDKIILEDALCVVAKLIDINNYKIHINKFIKLLKSHQLYRTKCIYIHHTNYFAFSVQTLNNFIFKISLFSYFILSLLFLKQISLSSVTHPMFKVLKKNVDNFNGVHPSFFKKQNNKIEKNSIYFIGKLIQFKNINKFIEIVKQISINTKISLKIIGEPFDEFKDKNKDFLNSIDFQGKNATSEPYNEFDDYQIFFNPSLSEVLCTTTAEAVCLNKWVIIPDHPSNNFFKQFKNVLFYQKDEEILSLFYYSFNNKIPLIDNSILSWEISTEKFIKKLIE